MTEETTAKKDTRDKLIGVVFTLALFVLLVWGILQLADYLTGGSGTTTP